MNPIFHTNKVLTNISIDFANEANHIADKVFPRVMVKRDADKYAVYDSHFRVADDQKADGARASRVTFSATTTTYNADDYALEDVITPRQLRNTDAPINLEKDSTEFLTRQIMDNKEVRAAALLFTSASWTNNATLSATYNDYTADVADPLTAFDTGAVTVMKAIARMPNKAVIGRDTLSHLKNNYKVIERIKYTQRASVTPDLLAAMFEVGEVMVGTHVNDTTNEATTSSGGFTWGDNIWLGYIETSPGLKKPSATYQFSTTGLRVRKWNDQAVEGSTVIEAMDNYDLVIPATGAGYLIVDTDASG